MAKIEVPYDRHISQLLTALGETGVLLVSVDPKGKPNAMTIGWAQIGIIWGRRILTVMVRPSRYTFGCLEATQDFTVCIPYANQSDLVAFCGSKSGRDEDKFKRCGFTATVSEMVKSPGIGECGLIYECQVVNYNDFVATNLTPEVCTNCYPGGDYHRAYFGEILRVTADSDFEKQFEG